jgi:hypothetical protein
MYGRDRGIEDRAQQRGWSVMMILLASPYAAAVN